MADVLLTGFLSTISYSSFAQNLVPNPGFELISTCNVAGLMDAMQNSLSDWSTYDYSANSPDIFNECFTYPVIQLPNSTFGYTYANSGTGCIGIGAGPHQNDYREVVSNQLTQPLIQDSAYCVSFFVKNSKGGGETYFSNNLGLLFTQDVINNAEVHQQNSDIFPEFAITGNSWVEVSNYYIASGGEQFVHIGFFGEPHSYYVDPNASGVIYYYVDDVSVTPCNKDSLLNVTLELPNVFTPNQDGDNDLYAIRQQNIKTLEVAVFNRWGELVLEYDGKTGQWDGKDAQGEEVSDGVYFVKVLAETAFGEVISKQQVVHIFRKNN